MAALSVQPAVAVLTRTSLAVPFISDPFTTPRGSKSVGGSPAYQRLSWDWPVMNSTKSITGISYDPGGSPVPGATCLLVREADNQVVQTATSNGSGIYTWPRDADDPYTYYVVSFIAGSPQRHGISNKGLVPS